MMGSSTKEGPSRDQDEMIPEKIISKENNMNKKGEGGGRSRSKKDKGEKETVGEKEEMGVAHVAEENLLLRRHLRKQEDKIKLLATKLVRIVGERRNKEKRDEILIEEQKSKIASLEHQIANLRDKVSVSRQQLASYTKLIPSHSSLHLPHPTTISCSSKSVKSVGKHKLWSGGKMDADEFTSRVEQLLLEAKAENQALENQLSSTMERLSLSEQEVERGKDRVRELESSHEEQFLKMRGQLEGEHDRTKKKKTLADNIQLIRLQRETRRTSSWLSTLETQCRSLECSLSSATETIAQLEGQVANLQEELREGQQKALSQQKELEDSGGELSRLKELEATITALQEENIILKETNDTLLNKTLSSASLLSSKTNLRERHDSGELRAQLSHLESTLKKELTEKMELVRVLSAEKTKASNLEENASSLNDQVDQLNGKVKELANELENERKLNLERVGLQEKHEKEEWDLGQTQWQLVQVRDELDKTRSLLRTQMTINKECAREVDILTSKLDKAESFHHQKLQEFMELLEQRTKQMSLLETTLQTISRTPIAATRSVQLNNDAPQVQVGE